MSKAKEKPKAAAKKRAAPKAKPSKSRATKAKAKPKPRKRAAAKAKPKKAPPVPPRLPPAPGIPEGFNPQLVLMSARSHGGRPTDYSPDICDRVYAWYSIGYTVPMICRELGICKQTYYNWTQEHPEFLDCHSRGKIACQGFYEQAMRLAAIGAVKNYRHSPAAAIMRHHYGYNEPDEELSDGDNQPMLVVLGDYIEPEETIKEIEADNVKTA